ncbi:MAG: DUF169 domain-containing protein [Syntrophales bacterium]|nr:DUF169 domain-containing protein [Syntrophales bacterium]
MSTNLNLEEVSEFIRNTIRLKSYPVASKFLKDTSDFPEKTRTPSKQLGKKVSICQALSMARLYGWTVGITKEDVVCVPGAIVFGFSTAEDPAKTMSQLWCEGSYSKTEEIGYREAKNLYTFKTNEYSALLFSPLHRASFKPDTVVFYGNPAQLMRLIHAWTYGRGTRVMCSCGGKVECSEYLIAPFITQDARLAIPGTGDRIFSLTQDDEMIFAIPGAFLSELFENLKEAGKKVGATYPIPMNLNFQPEFPKFFKELGRKIGIES